jgi:protein-L-isoaspartate(D-aspartate) O-methyltransferase
MALQSFIEQRKDLVSNLEKRGYIKSEVVRNAMLNVPRECFVPSQYRNRAYEDSPLPTYKGQTISAPHMNAMMCELLDVQANEKVLEIGTGSGYHASLLGFMISQQEGEGHVYTIERVKELVEFAKKNIEKVQLEKYVTVVCDDGTKGYPNAAPFDKILVTAAGPEIPKPLLDQLAEGGKICIPIGGRRWSQKLIIITKKNGQIEENVISSVMFVPLIGEFGFDLKLDE